jgi:hypothetical protein
MVGATALAVGLVLSACGGDDGDAISSRAAARLQEQVAAVQYASAGEAYGPAREGLDEIRATTARLVERGEIDPRRAAQILEEIDRVDAALARTEAG